MCLTKNLIKKKSLLQRKILFKHDLLKIFDQNCFIKNLIKKFAKTVKVLLKVILNQDKFKKFKKLTQQFFKFIFNQKSINFHAF